MKNNTWNPAKQNEQRIPLFPVPAAEELLLKCIEELQVEAGSLFAFEPGRSGLCLIKAVGPRENHHCGERLALGEGISGTVAQRGKPLQSNQEEAKLRVACRKEEEEITPFLSYPVMKGSKVVAVINLSGPRDGRRFTERDIRKCGVICKEYAHTFYFPRKSRTLSFPDSNIYKIVRKKPKKEILRRKRLKAELKLLSHLPFCVLLFDSQFTVTFWNKKGDFKPFTGEEEDFPKKQVNILQLPLDLKKEGLKEKLDDMREKGRPFRLNNIKVIGVSENAMANAFFAPLYAIDGGFEGGLAVLADNTSNYEVQQKLLEAERLSLIGSLTSMITHEINNPLDGVIRLIKLSMDKRQQGLPNDEYLEQALKGLHRMSSLMRSLLGFSRIGSEAASLHATIDNVISLCRYRDCSKGIKFSFESGLDDVLVNENDFHQILTNLIANAIDAIDSDSGVVGIKTHLDQENLIVSIQDNGCGIPQAVRSRIFDAFWSTKEYGRGTGLGLTIVKKIIQKHGGTLQVESEEYAGTTISLTIPKDRLVI